MGGMRITQAIVTRGRLPLAIPRSMLDMYSASEQIPGLGERSQGLVYHFFRLDLCCTGRIKVISNDTLEAK